ncbi:hypothetical protein NC652_002328 [Populus alba x Populus x berolinensis]|nr:hypothetical protein NC652_002328 [Populus alba x Populus x berolinensis]
MALPNSEKEEAYNLSNRPLHETSTFKFSRLYSLDHEPKPEFLDFDFSWFDPADRYSFDVIVIGTGPVGPCLAEQVSRFGVKVCRVDTAFHCGLTTTDRFHEARVWKVEHEEFESSIVCDDENELKTSLVVDAAW